MDRWNSMLPGERRNLCVFGLSGCRFSGQYPTSFHQPPLRQMMLIGDYEHDSNWGDVKSPYEIQTSSFGPFSPITPLAVAAQILFVLDQRTQVPRQQELIVMSFSSLFLTIYRTQRGLKRCVFSLCLTIINSSCLGLKLSALDKGL